MTSGKCSQNKLNRKKSKHKSANTLWIITRWYGWIKTDYTKTIHQITNSDYLWLEFPSLYASVFSTSFKDEDTIKFSLKFLKRKVRESLN